jgi:hypothetical protein
LQLQANLGKNSLLDLISKMTRAKWTGDVQTPVPSKKKERKKETKKQSKAGKPELAS